jgi:hypothetical protein
MKKIYMTPEMVDTKINALDCVMQVIASDRGIEYGGTDPGDGTIDPESKDRDKDMFEHGLW